MRLPQHDPDQLSSSAGNTSSNYKLANKDSINHIVIYALEENSQNSPSGTITQSKQIEELALIIEDTAPVEDEPTTDDIYRNLKIAYKHGSSRVLTFGGNGSHFLDKIEKRKYKLDAERQQQFRNIIADAARIHFTAYTIG